MLRVYEHAHIVTSRSDTLSLSLKGYFFVFVSV